MRVLLVRHGIAHDRADPDCPPDADRGLTLEGRQRTKKCMAVAARFTSVTRVLSSPYARARQTAELLLDARGLDGSSLVLSDALMPDAPAYAVFQLLHAFIASDVEVACVGHAPHLDHMIALALANAKTPFTSLKKAGLAMLELDALPRASGELLWMMPPRMLLDLL
jgi:phosphohistidine phosphatase